MEAKNHINVLELKVVKFGIMIFTKMFPTAMVVHLQVGSTVALSYLNMMGDHNKIISNLVKKIWDYLLANGITNTVQYLLGVLNPLRRFLVTREQLEIRSGNFSTNLQNFLDSRFSTWKPDSFSRGAGAFQRSWNNLKGYTFPPFCLIGTALRKLRVEMATIILVTPAWQE